MMGSIRVSSFVAGGVCAVVACLYLQPANVAQAQFSQAGPELEEPSPSKPLPAERPQPPGPPKSSTRGAGRGPPGHRVLNAPTAAAVRGVTASTR